MAERSTKKTLLGLSKKERAIMGNLLRMPPEHHRDAAKPASPKGEGQRRRREKERTKSCDASRDL
jgi:hypothetical protein